MPVGMVMSMGMGVIVASMAVLGPSRRALDGRSRRLSRAGGDEERFGEARGIGHGECYNVTLSPRQAVPAGLPAAANPV